MPDDDSLEKLRKGVRDHIDLSQKFLKVGDHELRGTVAERYLRGELCLHLHVWNWRGNGNDSDYCIVFESCGAVDSNGGINCPRELDGETWGSWQCDGKEPVLVCGVEFFDGPQSTISRLLPGLVRLHSFDQCARTVGTAGEPFDPSGSMGPIFCPVIENGKHRLPISGISACKLPNDVVERRPHVMHAITDQQRELLRRNGFRIDELNEIASVFRIRFDGDRIGVAPEKLADTLFNSFEVGLRAIPFRTTCFQTWWADHVVNSAYEQDQAKTEDSKGAEIPIPKRSEFLRDLKKLDTPEKSRPRRPKK